MHPAGHYPAAGLDRRAHRPSAREYQGASPGRSRRVAATASFFEELPGDRADTVAAGLFGPYTDPKRTAIVADNVRRLWPEPGQAGAGRGRTDRTQSLAVAVLAPATRRGSQPAHSEEDLSVGSFPGEQDEARRTGDVTEPKASAWAQSRFGDVAADLARAAAQAIHQAHAMALAAHVSGGLDSNDTYGATLHVAQYVQLAAEATGISSVSICKPKDVRCRFELVHHLLWPNDWRDKAPLPSPLSGTSA